MLIFAKIITKTDMAKQISSGIAANYREVIAGIQQHQFAPIYLLMGDESYYLDLITNALTDNVVTEEEKDFNLITIYCTRETNVADVVNAARRYPMMAKYQLVIVKEAQNLLNFEDLKTYCQNPLQSTVLAISYKNGSVPKNRTVYKLIQAKGIVFESKKLKDGQLPTFITDYLRQKQVGIEEKATMMLVENIGADLNRMAGELDKLCISLPQGQTRITPELIEKSIGISREFNLWEFRSAVVERNVVKANKILNFFNANPKANAPIAIVATLFNFFASIMQAHYSPDKTDQGIMNHLDIHSSWIFREYKTAMRNFSAMKTMKIIEKLRETDTRLKGIDKGDATDAEIMQELLYFMLH